MDEIFRVIFQQKQDGEKPPVEQRKPKGSPLSRVLISLLITLFVGGVYFYVKLPPINLHAGAFYGFLLLLLIVFSVSMNVLSGFRSASPKEYVGHTRRQLAIPFYLICLILAVMLVGSITGWVVFRSKAYSELLPLETGDFTAEVAEISFNQIPMLDSGSANNLTNRKLGELSDLVSQFTVSASSVQINYRDQPVRVTYLNYDNFFKWLSNRKEGLPAYMYVDMVTQEVSVMRLQEGMHYSPSELFTNDLDRWLRFHYPTKIFASVNFEIDEDGTPCWVAPVVCKRIGLFDGEDIEGAVILNAVTGESTYYSVGDVPVWVDRVYPSELLMVQYDYYGRYHNGFLNAFFGQENCSETSEGYNYIALNDDVWVYTGVTSVSSDLGNIGFILVNQRTKEARYYSCAGAEEYSAMSSAEGAVQQYKYNSTFPLLLNIADQPSYFMALKDAAGLVKMYAMVNVQQYQIVATGSTVAACQENYRELLVKNGLASDEEAALPEQTEYAEVSGAIAEIRSATMEGDTFYFLRLEGGDTFFRINARENELTVILNVGDEIVIQYLEAEGEIIAATAVTRK